MKSHSHLDVTSQVGADTVQSFHWYEEVPNTPSLRLRPDACGAMPTREPSTIAAYRREYCGLISRSKPDADADDYSRLLHTIDWFARQNGAWAAATIRKYGASLRLAVEDWTLAAINTDAARISRLHLDLNIAKPAPRDRAQAPRTSAKKRISFTWDERKRLVSHLAESKTTTGRLLAGMIGVGALVGLRPREWINARVVGDELIVQCAKRTNGRGVAKERPVTLAALSAAQRRSLMRFVDRFQKEAAKVGVWQRFHERMAKALTRACQKLNIPEISLYTLRHQAVATAKRYMTQREVAALFGHATVTTATRHYARRRGGWKVDPLIRPSPSVVVLVRQPDRIIGSFGRAMK